MNKTLNLTSFYTMYYTQYKDLYLEFSDFGLTEKNYWKEVLKPSNISNSDFKEIEIRIKRPLPQVFKSFYQEYKILDGDIESHGIRIAGNLEALKGYISFDDICLKILAQNLIPFGIYNDEWFVCLNMNELIADPPIALFEMSNWHNGQKALSHRNWFSSYSSFILCIEEVIDKKSIKNVFDCIDPMNNFYKAYNYWK